MTPSHDAHRSRRLAFAFTHHRGAHATRLESPRAHERHGTTGGRRSPPD